MTEPEWMQLKSIALHDGTDTPQLWPNGASPEYVDARMSLRAAERALRDQVEEVARLRRALPEGSALSEYKLTEGSLDLEADGPTQQVRLVDLFGNHDVLVVYHLMFHPDDDQACPMCSLWVDGLHGVSHHIAQWSGCAVIGKAPLDKLRAWARHRGWQGLRLVSSHGTSFNADMHVETAKGGQWPAVSVFARDRDEVRHVVTESADFPDRTGRGIDLLSPVWNVLDLLPQGRGEWNPDNTYPGDTRGEPAA
jgi:predicted dithiol-disulfide oxidoreductase (DUF899 family)